MHIVDNTIGKKGIFKFMEDRSTESAELSVTDESENGVKTEGCRFGCEHRVQGAVRPAEWCVGFRAGRR